MEELDLSRTVIVHDQGHMHKFASVAQAGMFGRGKLVLPRVTVRRNPV